MTISRSSLYALGALMLAACSTTGDSGSRTVSGKYMGEAKWQDIPVSETSVDLPYQIPYEITQVKRRSLPHRRQEIVGLKNGVIRVTEFYGHKGVSKKIRESHFKTMFDSMDLVSENADVQGWRIRINGLVQWAPFKYQGRPCVAATRPLGERRGRGYAAMALGFVCGKEDEEKNTQENDGIRFFAYLRLK